MRKAKNLNEKNFKGGSKHVVLSDNFKPCEILI